MSIICIGLASVSTIIFSQKYSSDLNNYCDIILKNDSDLDENYKKDCTKFSSNETEIYSNIIQIDWLISMSAHNIKNYHNIFEYNTTDDQKNKIEDLTLDYSFMYFLTGITILVADYLFILDINLLDECQNFQETTPSDYTVLIHGVPKPENNNQIKEEVLNIVREVSFLQSPLQIYQIIPCLRFAEIYNIAKEKFEEETKIYHVNHFEKQKQLNREYGFDNNNNLHYFNEIFCIKKKLQFIISKIK